MNDEKFARLIKKELDNDVELDSGIIRRLHQQRQRVLDQIEQKQAGGWFRQWGVPAATAAMLLIALLTVLPQRQQDIMEIAILPAEDIEIISTMDFEDLENLDFYNWLDMQEGKAG